MNENRNAELIAVIVLAIAAMLLFLSSCGVKERIVYMGSSDSTVVEIRDRWVTVRDTVYMELPRQESERTVRDSVSFLENGYSESEARINIDGSLYHSLRLKERRDTFPTYREVLVKDSIVYRDKSTTKVVEVERALTGWQKFRLRLGEIFFALLILGVVYVAVRVYLRK